MSKSRPLFGGVILLYFIIALEVLIMISPFAAFFYAAFNPVLLFLARWPETRWLAAFFLPHMVLPPGLFLKAVRVAGSVLFVGGSIVFLACAGQVYFHKFSRRGPALGGLYRWMRHPQYLALGAAGLGLAILWPRFLTIVLWTVMVGLYDLLARDEERRMVKQFGDQYREYIARTGMFFPRRLENVFGRLPFPKSPLLRPLLGFVILVVVTVGSAFALRAYTVARLPLWSSGSVTALAILPGDGSMLEHQMEEVLELPDVKSRLGEVAGTDPRLLRSAGVHHAGNDRRHAPRVASLRAPPDPGDDRGLDLPSLRAPPGRPRDAPHNALVLKVWHFLCLVNRSPLSASRMTARGAALYLSLSNSASSSSSGTRSPGLSRTFL